MNSGFVYLLVNSAMPGLVKIGKTDRDPEARARELSSTTGVPSSFVVVHSVFVINCSELERTIHRKLDYCREHRRREFFRISVSEAIQVIQPLKTEHERRFPPPDSAITISQQLQQKRPVGMLHNNSIDHQSNTTNSDYTLYITNEAGDCDIKAAFFTRRNIWIIIVALSILWLAVMQYVYETGPKIWVISAAVVIGVAVVRWGWLAILAERNVTENDTDYPRGIVEKKEIQSNDVKQQQCLQFERARRNNCEGAD